MGLFDALPYSNFHELNQDWIIAFVAEAKKIIEKYTLTVDDLSDNNAKLTKAVAELEERLNEYDIKIVKELVDKYLREVLSGGVYFGLTDSGYFYASIPEGWSNIKFNTTVYDIQVALQPEFGHLVLSY